MAAGRAQAGWSGFSLRSQILGSEILKSGRRAAVFCTATAMNAASKAARTRGMIGFYAGPRRSGAMRADTLFWAQPLNIAKIS
ncbi:hypothetical protein ASF36_07975 [Methylobacterium sp. Leaf90]|jgi:hypothetical protein|nr:hypothetical protein ASF36_07975 [Methylobacterium sp. Leaf90]